MSNKAGKSVEKTRFKKCASAPKRFKSAFMIYSAHRQKQIRKELGENEVSQLLTRHYDSSSICSCNIMSVETSHGRYIQDGFKIMEFTRQN